MYTRCWLGTEALTIPVQNMVTSKVEVSTQNHGFAVDRASITDDIAKVTHRNLNDETIEGVRFANCSAFSVQYHPESSPGPHDSHYLFDEFMSDIEKNSGVKATKIGLPDLIKGRTTDLSSKQPTASLNF